MILSTFLKANSTRTCMKLHCRVMQKIHVYCTYYVSNNMVFLKEHLVGYTHANFHHATTFGCRNIAFQIWWLPWNTQRSNWPKTFCGRWFFPFSYTNFWSSEFVIIFFMKYLQDSFQAATEHKPRQVRWGGLHPPVVTEWWPACLHKQFPSVHHRGN